MNLIKKTLVASLGVGVIISAASKALLPDVPILLMMVASVATTLAFAGVVLLYSRIVIAWRAYCLRQGAIDPAWLWFPNDPPGLRRKNRKRDSA
ncbi:MULTISPECIES: hypothetical protein [unclassified Rhizobacter]|uniref:hypothetical protein n=1 Tax=unclassified Rhizobacter TaxID=2640088 RepID=UPI0012FB66B1|nr:MULTISPECIES: hypothetical protein [unclassified Rhizobacter]